MSIAKKILKNYKKSIMAQFGIDKYTFDKSGISKDTINQIYRCLCVYPTGFHQMLSVIVNKVRVVST